MDCKPVLVKFPPAMACLPVSNILRILHNQSRRSRASLEGIMVFCRYIFAFLTAFIILVFIFALVSWYLWPRLTHGDDTTKCDTQG